MTALHAGSDVPACNVTALLLPFTLVYFLGYAAVGLPISTLPLQVHGLGYGTAVIGLVMGLAPGVTLLGRQPAGMLADRYGPKKVVLAGLAITALSGVAYLIAALLPARPALASLMVGRAVLGLGDSVFTTALMAWVVSRVGPAHAGRALSWCGIAMYAALALGAPFGALLGSLGGNTLVAVAVVALPLAAIPLCFGMTDMPAASARRGSMVRVVGAIWAPGLGMVLASGGFGTIAAFLALYYANLGWSGAGMALMAFGGAYIVARLFFAGLPDRIGGTRVAAASLVIEALGLVLIAKAGTPGIALLGAGLTGLGYSLIFPSLGVEVVRLVSPDNRGVALGAFLACFDLGLGAAGPAMGLVAAGHGLPAAFAAAAAACLVSLVLIWATHARR